MAGDLVALTLIAPKDEFVYSPLTVERPFSVGRMRSVFQRTLGAVLQAAVATPVAASSSRQREYAGSAAASITMPPPCCA